MPSNPLAELPIVEYIRLVGLGTLAGIAIGVAVTLSLVVQRLRHMHDARFD